jgi:hypothetical protein
LALLPSLTGGGRSVGKVRSRTEAMELWIFKHFGKLCVTGSLVSDVSKDCITFSGSTLRNVSL